MRKSNFRRLFFRVDMRVRTANLPVDLDRNGQFGSGVVRIGYGYFQPIIVLT